MLLTKRLLAALIALVMVAAACGSGDTDDASDTTQPADEAVESEDEAEAEPADEDADTEADDEDSAMEDEEAAAGVCDGEIDGPVTLRLTSHSSDDAYTNAVADFNAGPGADLGVTVELVDLGEDSYEDFIVAAAASDELPDIMDMDGPFLYNFAWNGFVQPLGNCADDAELDDFLPSIVAQGTYNDELYSLGSFDSGMGLWAKRSALEGVGARIPTDSTDAWTTEEFEQILRDLDAGGVEGPLDIKFWYGAGEWRPYGFAPIIQSGGGDVIDRNGFQTADGALNSPEAVAAMSTFQTWVTDGLVDIDAVDDTNFIEGDAAISWVGHWMYPAYSEALGDDLVLLPLPDFGTGSKAGMGSWNWAMSSAIEDPDAAWAFIDFVTSAEQVKAISDAEGAVPSRQSVLDADPSFSPGGDRHLYVLNLQAANEIAIPRPATPAYGAVRDAFSDAFADIVSGGDVQETLDRAVEEIDADIEANSGYPTP